MPSDAADGITTWLGNLSPASVLLAVVIVVAGVLLGRAAARATTALAGRLRGLSPAAVPSLARIARYFVLLLAIGLALSVLGAEVQPLLTAALIVAVVAALALRGISDNFAAGIILQTRRPLEVGDLVRTEDHTGTVTEMNGRSIVLATSDGRVVHVPNSLVLQNPLVNYSTAGSTRSEVEVRVRVTGADHHRVKHTLGELVAAVHGVDSSRGAQVLTVLQSPESLTVRVLFWHNPTHGAETCSAVVAALADGLAAQDLEAVVTSTLPQPPLTPPTAL